jgi:formate hydrogenlyase subunit 3/multisubunit Na+/H+ antiporter MnhD subunit
MSALATLMIVSGGALLLCAGLGSVDSWRTIGIWTGAVGSAVLAAAGVVAVFDGSLVWQPFSWFPFGHGGVQVDSLAGLFLIITGLVCVPLFLANRTDGARLSHVLRPILVLCVVGLIVVDNVFEFLILFELTVVAIYALVSVRYRDPRALRAAALTLTLAKLGGGAVLAGLVLLAVQAGTFSFEELVHVGPSVSSAARGVCFVLLFAGFAVKAALIPLQTWLPGAYAGTDADSSGFIAAVSTHSFAKAGLFAAVAAVEHSTGTSDMERLGGLYRALPAAATATLAGGAALAALPPFSGFVSEWLGLEGLMQGFRVSGTGSHLAIAFAGALLALTAGLAALAFVRAIGMTFLGMPRDRAITPRREPAHPARRHGAACLHLVRDRGGCPLGREGARARDAAGRRRRRGRPHQPARLVDRAGLREVCEHQPNRARAHADRFRARRGWPALSHRRPTVPPCAGVGVRCGGLRPARAVHADRIRQHGAGDLQRRLQGEDPAAEHR